LPLFFQKEGGVQGQRPAIIGRAALKIKGKNEEDN
jgi:hypothetical protein